MPQQAHGAAPDSVHLRDVTPSDLPALYQHQLDPDAIRMAAVNPRSAEAFDAHWAKILADKSVVAKAILADAVLVGSISCFHVDDQRWVGYWIDKEYWGRGIATRALAALLEEIPRRPLHARVARHNVASIRVLERCGFVITGYAMSLATERFQACEEAMLVLT